jgi:hypothetical protein
MPEPSLARTGIPPQQPDDYDRIHDAFAQTERGRWFLEEFVRRNGNPEIAMLLQAIERIEAAILAKNTAADASPYRSTLEDMARLLALRAPASADADGAAGIEAASGAIRKAAEELREIGWSMREQNDDQAVPDRLDSHVAAIAAACAALTEAAAREHETGRLLADLRAMIDAALAGKSTAPAPEAAEPAFPETDAPAPQATVAESVERQPDSPQWVVDNSDPPPPSLAAESLTLAADPAEDPSLILPPTSPDPEPIQAIAREINHALAEDAAPAPETAAPPAAVEPVPVEPSAQTDTPSQPADEIPASPQSAEAETQPEPAAEARRPSSAGQAAVLTLRQHMKAAQNPKRDPLAPLTAMSDEEKLALFT